LKVISFSQLNTVKANPTLGSKGAAQANNLLVLTQIFNKLSPKTPDNLIPSTDKASYD
jgi:hypothetical protein